MNPSLRFARTEKILGKNLLSRLQKLNVAIVGVGGVGSYTAMLLAQLGVRSLTLIDFDVVQESNLSRQLYSPKDVGKKKVLAAKARLRNDFPKLKIVAVSKILDEDNAKALLRSAHVIMDCTDNFHTRQEINRAARSLRKPWVYSGAIEEKAMAALLLPGNGPCFECFAREPNVLESCEAFGVTPMACSMAAAIQVQALLNLLRENHVGGKLFFIDLSDGTTAWKQLKKRAKCWCQE